MKGLFVDTAGWMACADAGDPAHRVAASARDAWLAATEKFIGNPSSPHRLGGRADKALADARTRVAHFR